MIMSKIFYVDKQTDDSSVSLLIIMKIYSSIISCNIQKKGIVRRDVRITRFILAIKGLKEPRDNLSNR